jgi:hypothetical protein
MLLLLMKWKLLSKTETVKQTASTPNEDTVEAIAEEVKPTDALILETGNQTVLMHC